MKKILAILIAGIFILPFSCQDKNKNNTPEKVTEIFVKAFNTGDFAKMNQYSTKRSHVLIKDMQTRRNSAEMEMIRSRKIEVSETTITEQTDSTAMCVCKFTVDGAPAAQTWPLKLENGEWKVMMVQ